MKTFVLSLFLLVNQYAFSQEQSKILPESFFIGLDQKNTLKTIQRHKWEFAEHTPSLAADTFVYVKLSTPKVLTLVFAKKTKLCTLVKMRLSYFQTLDLIELLNKKATHFGSYPNSWQDNEFNYQLDHHEYYFFILTVKPRGK